MIGRDSDRFDKHLLHISQTRPLAKPLFIYFFTRPCRSFLSPPLGHTRRLLHSCYTTKISFFPTKIKKALKVLHTIRVFRLYCMVGTFKPLGYD